VAYGCPYRGLLPFEEDDGEVFYGPERLTIELAVRLARQMTLGGVVGVTGASEAGKSSLLRAGLLPTLARGMQLKGSEHWSYRVIMPTMDPLTELATAPAVLGSSDTAAARPIGAVLPPRAALPGGGGPPVSGGGRVVVGSLVKPSGLALTMPADMAALDRMYRTLPLSSLVGLYDACQRTITARMSTASVDRPKPAAQPPEAQASAKRRSPGYLVIAGDGIVAGWRHETPPAGRAHALYAHAATLARVAAELSRLPALGRHDKLLACLND
jgi:hypothetical protein